MDNGSLFGGGLLGGQGILKEGLLEGATLEGNDFLGLTDLLQSMGQRTGGAMDLPELSPFTSSGVDEGGRGTNRPDLPAPQSPNSSPSRSGDPVLGNLDEPVVGGPQFRSDVTMNPAFTIQAEGRVVINGRGDFDGDALNTADDALIYGGQGVRINGRPTLAVQRREDGSVIEDEQGRALVVDNAIAVGSDDTVYRVPDRQYGGLDTPNVVEGISVEVPDFESIVSDHLAEEIPAGTNSTLFNPRDHFLYNSHVWRENFPSGGTVDEPTVVEVQGGGINVPWGVNIENTVIIVNQGNINFNGWGHRLKNVTLVTHNGSVNLNNVQAEDLTVLSSKAINMNGGARFGGQSFLATGNRNIVFNGSTQTDDDSHLTVISQKNIIFNNRAETRGTFQAAGNVTLNGRSRVVGSIQAEGNIRLNGQATVMADVDNQMPTDVLLDNAQVAENNVAEAVVGTLSTVDPTPGDSHSYELVAGAGDLDNSRFDIVNNQLRILESADFESQDSYSVRVRSTDASGASATKALTIAVVDVNEAPSQIQLSATSVAENSGSGTVIGQFSTVDPDAGDSHVYRLVNDADRRFRIVEGQLEVAPDANLDFEGISSFAIEVESTDREGLTQRQQFVIAVTDVNEAPTAVVLSNATVDENAAVDTVVGTLSSVDPDANDSHVYELIDAAEGRFLLVGGQLQVAGVLDFEAQSSFEVVVRTTDSGDPGFVFDQVLTIEVVNVNEGPQSIEIDNSLVDEDAAVGAVVGTLSTTDPDAGDSHTYTLLDNAGGRFQIVGNELQVAGELDFEDQAQFMVTVRSVDGEGLSVTEQLEIGVGDVNEAPTGISLDGGQVDENVAAGSVVGTLGTTDPDAGDSHSYELVAGDGDADNGAFTLVGNQLQINDVPDYEAQSSYSVRVRSIDAEGLAVERMFSIAVVNVNEAPVEINLTQATVAENSGADAVVGVLSTVDPDGGSHVYTLVNDAEGRFVVEGNQLRVADGADLDFEDQSSFEIVVRSTDEGNPALSVEQVFTVQVTDINEAPTSIVLSHAEVDENAAAGTVIGVLGTTDPDLGDSHVYSLVDDAAGRFEIVGNQVRVADGADLDFEDLSSLVVRVRSTDAEGLFVEDDFEIALANVNEGPSGIGLSGSSVAENTAVGTVIGLLSTTDPDAGDSHSYSLLNDAGGRFKIVGNELQVAGELDFEDQASVTIAVRSVDAMGLSFIREFEIELTNVNEAPGNLSLDQDAVDENVAAGSLVGTLDATDPDIGDVQTFSLVSGEGDADNAAFTIVGNQLQIVDSPDFEAQSSYQIRVRSTDAEGLSTERMFSVRIRDINEAPTVVSLDGNGVIENASAGTVVGSLSSIDPDLGDSHSYELVNDAGGRLEIIDGQLQVAEGAAFDYESERDLQVVVRSVDAGGLAVEETFTIYVLDAVEGLMVTANLVTDTGADAADRITSEVSIAGSIAGGGDVAHLWVGLNEATAEQYLDLRVLVQPDGSFVLNETVLAQVFGGAIPDGDHVLHLQAVDVAGEISEFFDVNFTLDRVNPLVDLVTPLVNGQHSNQARLLGTVTDETSAVESVSAAIDGVSRELAFDADGNLDAALAEGLTEGAHQLVLTVVDVAGNQFQVEVDFEVANDAIILGPQGSAGWGARSDDQVVLSEGDALVTEASVAVDLGQEVGSRTLRFDVEALFDEADAGAGDRLLVSLVDANDPTVKLLGEQGSPIFTLSESGPEFQAGLVRFDGSEVEIDVTSLRDEVQGRLVFQLVNADGDTGSRVQVSGLVSEIDEAGVESPVFPYRDETVQPGGELDLGNLNPTDAIEVIWSDVRLDAVTGEYRAKLQLRNTGMAIGRQVAVVFENLPDGVALVNASGAEVDGDPYVNVRSAIRPGGLAEGAISDSVEVVFSNPGLLQLDLETVVLAGGTNQAPVFEEPIVLPDLMPGGVLKLPLNAVDPDGDVVTYTLRTDGDLPTGQLRGNGVLEFRPRPDQVGEYVFTVVASDGALEATQEVTLNVVADPVTTTRISGVIENIEQEPLVGVVIELEGVETLTDENGAFTLEFVGDLPGDTLKIRGEGITGDEVYPFIAEKLPLVLGHEVYSGVNNVIDRPIYLPALDVASGQTIDPTRDVTVTTENIPGAAVTVAAGSLMDQEGNPFTGVLSITEVPTDLTPAALPPNLSPDMVVTIQPGEMVFTTPAALSLPNTAGYAPGTQMDLWSINPETGDFDKVGVGQVSADGSVIETIEGGIRNSSWHFFAPFIRAINDIFKDLFNQDVSCPCKPAKIDTNSEVELHSGALTETHNLVTYNSLGRSRGLQLTYDSLRADPRPIVQFSYGHLEPKAITNAPERLKLLADLKIHRDGFDIQAPGYPNFTNSSGGELGGNLSSTSGLQDGKYLWSVPSTPGEVNAAIQSDLRSLSSGQYDYTLTTGVRLFVREQLFGTSTSNEGKLLHINGIGNIFGNGWGISGLQELVENADGSILLIDGDGSEMLFEAPSEANGTYQSPPADFSVFEKRPDGTFRRTMKDQTVYIFNAENQLASVVDRNGNETRYTYNDDQQIVQITDPVGLQTTFSYTGNYVSQITDPAGRTTQLEHDASGNLIRVTDPDGSSRTWTYDSEHHMTGEIDQRGYREQSFYNFAGRVTKSIRKDGSVIEVDSLQIRGLHRPEVIADIDSAPLTIRRGGPTASFTDGSGNVTRMRLNQAGQEISTNDGQGAGSTTTRNNNNLVSLVTDGNGNQIEYKYDNFGNVVQTSDSFARGVKQSPPPLAPESSLFLNPLYSVESNSITADLNDDGHLDIIGTSKNGFSISYGDGLGHFQGAVSYGRDRPVGVFENLLTTYADDINSDGHLDLVGLSTAGASILLNQGNGRFNNTSTFIDPLPQSGNIETAELKDINGDGTGDLTFIITEEAGGGGVAAAFTSSFAASSLLMENNRPYRLVSILSQGDGTFGAPIETELIDRGEEISIVDLNNDSHEDIVVFRPNNRSFSTLLGNGDGTYGIETSVGLDIRPSAFSHADLNRDGYVDFVIANTSGSGDPVSVLLNTGDGSFAPAVNYTIGTSLDSIELADLNNDGYFDLVSADRTSQSVLVSFNQGNGTFVAPSAYTLPGNPNSVIVQDINDDGLNDILAYSYTGRGRFGEPINELSSFLNTGDNVFISAASYGDISFRPLELQDINEDGTQDLLGYSSQYGGTLGIAIGNGDGTFQVRPRARLPRVNEPIGPISASNGLVAGLINDDDTPDLVSVDYRYNQVRIEGVATRTTGDGPVAVALGDIDGDSKQDIAVANALSNTVSLFFNDGGSFDIPAVQLSVGNTPYDVALGDVNRDGHLDLVVVNSEDDNVSVFINRGDGDFEAPVNYASQYSPYNLELGDINRDGHLDIVVGHNAGGFSVLRNQGNGTFRSTTYGNFGNTSVDYPEGGPSLALGDIDKDGDLDVAIAAPGPNSATSPRAFVSVWRNQGNGLFEDSITYNVGRNPQAIKLGDITGDGHLDLVTINSSDASATILENDGQGNFLAQLRQDFGVGGFAGSLALADFDQDGDLDFATQYLNKDPNSSLIYSSSLSARNFFRSAGSHRLFKAFNNPDVDTAAPIESQEPLKVGDFKRYTYDPTFNQLTSYTDELGQSVVYRIDPNTGNRLSERLIVGVPGGDDDVVTEYTYTAQGLIDQMTDPLGRVTDYEYDNVGRLISITVALGTTDEAITRFEYDSAGNQTAVIDENGNRTEFAYDALNRLLRVTEADPDGAGPLAAPVTTYSYDAAGNLTTMEDARNHETRYQHDERNRLIQVTDALGGTAVYTYDTTGNLVAYADQLGNRTRYRYDQRNRRVATIDPSGFITQYDYDANDNLTVLTDALGNQTQYVFDARDRLTQRIDALGGVFQYGYDADDNLIVQIDENNHQTQFRYDDLDRLTQSTDALGGVSTYTYDEAGNRIGYTDELNRTTLFAYDNRNRLLTVTDPIGETVGYTYDAASNLTTLTDELNRVTTYGYDALNRLTTTTNPLGDTVTTVYDGVDNVVAIADELDRVTTFTYDSLNRQSSVTDPLGHTTQTQYDAVGNVTAVVDPLGHRTTFGYDALYRRTSSTDALGETTSFEFGAVGNLLAIVDPENNKTSYAYDELYRVVSDTNELGFTRRYRYDAVGNQTRITDRNGRVRDFAYDGLDRLTEESWLDESGESIYSLYFDYDAASQLESVGSFGDFSYQYEYDLAGRLTNLDTFYGLFILLGGAGGDQPLNVLLDYTYDAADNLLSVSDSTRRVEFIPGDGPFGGTFDEVLITGGTETFTYDALDRLTQVTQSGNGVAEKRVDFSYDAASQMTGSTRYSDLAGTQVVADSDYDFDLAGRLTSLTHSHDATTLAAYAWSYDAANRITQFTSPDGVSDYSYDERDQLVNSDHSYQTDENYSYDGNGNRTNAGYQTGLNNRLLSDGTYTYEYDAEGNRTKRIEINTGEVTEYTWDYRNRLTAVVTKHNTGEILRNVEYAYDAYDRRIEKSVDSDGEGPAEAEVERFVYDGDHIALVFDGEGNQTHRYLHGDYVDQVLAEETADGSVRWALADNQGTVRDVVDNNGSILNHISYESFGNVTSETNPDVDFRFGYTGREFDEETQQYYYRARYFDAIVGRFISVDPIGFNAGDANLYRYVYNSPLNATDPSGLKVTDPGGVLKLDGGLGGSPGAGGGGFNFKGPTAAPIKTLPKVPLESAGPPGPPLSPPIPHTSPSIPDFNAPITGPSAGQSAPHRGPVGITDGLGNVHVPQAQPEPQTINDTETKDCPDPPDDKKCKIKPIKRRGNDDIHDKFATQISNTTTDFLVTTPEGRSISFDGLTPGTRHLWEAKTRHQSVFIGSDHPFGSKRSRNIIHTMIYQALTQNEIAQRCDFHLTWAFNDANIANLVQDTWRGDPNFPQDVRYIYQPGLSPIDSNLR